MFAWLKKFFTDETAFTGAMRAMLLAGGAAVSSGSIPDVPPLLGALLMGAGGMLRAGEKNAKG